MTFHMRRKDKEITDERLLKKILKASKYITIALSMDNQPYLVSLSHGYDENRNCLYFHCAKEGKKLRYMKSNNIIWGQALLDYGYSEGDECTHLYASVHFSGKVVLVENLEEKSQAMECMVNHLSKNPEALIAKQATPDRLKNTGIGRIDIEYMSGKKSKEVTI
jgi:nitroimidazol reductase NimA-like FMN-containing flavoprotein (pyridoxamine 5'-phosphate oxidase superfamily)